jgi:hypothetical protein
MIITNYQTKKKSFLPLTNILNPSLPLLLLPTPIINDLPPLRIEMPLLINRLLA